VFLQRIVPILTLQSVLTSVLQSRSSFFSFVHGVLIKKIFITRTNQTEPNVNIVCDRTVYALCTCKTCQYQPGSYGECRRHLSVKSRFYGNSRSYWNWTEDSMDFELWDSTVIRRSICLSVRKKNNHE
jgi:hypothetical protein